MTKYDIICLGKKTHCGWVCKQSMDDDISIDNPDVTPTMTKSGCVVQKYESEGNFA